jgi:hypothetical protein
MKGHALFQLQTVVELMSASSSIDIGRAWGGLAGHSRSTGPDLMKAQHFLQISSAIIGKHRHRSDVTVNESVHLSLNSEPSRPPSRLRQAQAEPGRQGQPAAR